MRARSRQPGGRGRGGRLGVSPPASRTSRRGGGAAGDGRRGCPARWSLSPAASSVQVQREERPRGAGPQAHGERALHLRRAAFNVEPLNCGASAASAGSGTARTSTAA